MINTILDLFSNFFKFYEIFSFSIKYLEYESSCLINRFNFNMITVKTQIDRARTILNFDFCWKYYSKFLARPLAAATRTIREVVLFKGSSIQYLMMTCNEHSEKYPTIPSLIQEEEKSVFCALRRFS